MNYLLHQQHATRLDAFLIIRTFGVKSIYYERSVAQRGAISPALTIWSLYLKKYEFHAPIRSTFCEKMVRHEEIINHYYYYIIIIVVGLGPVLYFPT
jgi:hypothetical protein